MANVDIIGLILVANSNLGGDHLVFRFPQVYRKHGTPRAAPRCPHARRAVHGDTQRDAGQVCEPADGRAHQGVA